MRPIAPIATCPKMVNDRQHSSTWERSRSGRRASPETAGTNPTSSQQSMEQGNKHAHSRGETHVHADMHARTHIDIKIHTHRPGRRARPETADTTQIKSAHTAQHEQRLRACSYARGNARPHMKRNRTHTTHTHTRTHLRWHGHRRQIGAPDDADIGDGESSTTQVVAAEFPLQFMES
jgi:hypothetical protein